ncbi:MAG: PleD family two-component response regulator, partial [Pseudohongiellaceae bacterium]
MQWLLQSVDEYCAKEVVLQQDKDQTKIQTQAALEKPAADRLTVLLVEDDPGLRLMLRSVLEIHGFSVEEADSK